MAIEGVYYDGKLWAGKYDLSGDLNEIRYNGTAEILNATVFGNATTKNAIGLYQVQATASGFANFADNEQDEIVYGHLGSSGFPVTICGQNTPAEGEPCVFFNATQGAYTLGGAHGQLLPFSFEASAVVGHPPIRGIILEPGSTARTATGNGSGTNAPGAVASGSYAYAVLHCTSASAGDTLDVIIESDADGNFAAGATTRFTFTQISGGTESSQYMTRVAGPITDTYWRAKWTIAGTDESFTFAVAVGIV